jgi:hypothetical protein
VETQVQGFFIKNSWVIGFWRGKSAGLMTGFFV